MNWKSSLQILDLAPEDRLELVCRKCGRLRYITGRELQAREGAGRLYLDEVERKARCRQPKCGGAMRLAWPHPHETQGFVGGIT